MKTAFISTYYRKEELADIEKVKKEIKGMGFSNYSFYVADCTTDNRGYSAGINKGIVKAMKNEADIFVVFNPDISIKSLTKELIFAPSKYFDIWGYSHIQNGKQYYGGEIDKMRMSGGLITKKPHKRFEQVDFVSGSLIIFKHKVIEKVGLWNEDYFLYYDEVDFCERAKRKGLRIGIDSRHAYIHFESSNAVNPKKDYYLAQSRVMFLMRYGSSKQKLYEIIRSPKTIFEERRMLFQYIFTNRFLINFFSLNVSSFLIKMANFISFLFLVRYLTAPEYGIYTLVWAQVTLLSPLADLGTTSYGVVYLPREKEKEFESLLSLRFFISVIIFAVTVILSLLLFKNNSKIYWYIIITATVIFTNMFSGSYFILTAIKNRLYLSSRNSFIFNILLTIAVAISLFISKRLLYVFIIIFIFYNAYSLLNFIFITKEVKSLSLKFSPRKWFDILKQSYVFVLISFFAGLYFKLDVFLLKVMKGETEVGIYSAGYKFFEALLFVSTSYNVTAAPIFARIVENKRLMIGRIKKDLVFLGVIGFGAALIISAVSPFILVHIFKKSYTMSIPVLQIVIFSLPFILINSIWMNLLYVFKKAYIVIFIFIFQTLVNFILNYLLIPRYSYFASSYVTVASEIIDSIVLLLLIRHLWRKHYKIRVD